MKTSGVGKVSKELAKSQGKSTSKKVSKKMQEGTSKVKESLKPEKITKAMSPRSKKKVKEITSEVPPPEKSTLVSPDILRIPPEPEKPSALEEHRNITQVVGEMLSFLKSTTAQSSLEQKLDHIEDRIDFTLDQDRRQEVMDVFLEATKNKIEYQKKLKREQEEKAKPQKPIETKKESKGVFGSIIDTGKKVASTIKKGAEYIYKNKTAIVSGGAFIAGALSSGIAKGESGFAGYNAANMGTKGNRIVPVKEKLDLEKMTVEEVMRRQSIPWGAPNENEKLFAVGKYQVIPSTLKDAVNSLQINPKEPFTKELQEKIFNDYLIKKKRPAIAKYLNSPVDDPKLLNAALTQLSLEWASFADPNIPGGKTSHYGNGNKASISVEQATKMLQQDRMSNLQKVSQIQESTVGENLSTASAENINIKKQMVQQNMSTAIIQQNSVTNVVNKTSVTNVIDTDNTNPLLGQ